MISSFKMYFFVIFAYLLMNTVVKNWIKSTTNRTFVLVLFILVILNIYGSVTDKTVVLQTTKALSIPLFFSIYFIKNKFINNIFIALLLLAFVGDLFSMITANPMQLKITSAAYFCCYATLILIGVFRIKGFKFKGFVGAYLVIVFLLNGYFMYSLYGMMSYSISDVTELFFTTLQIIALLVLGFVAFAGYLNEDGRQSIIFLMMSFCLIFSQVLNFVETYYISYNLFVILEWSSHIAGLILLYKYIVEHNRLRKKRMVIERISAAEKIAA